MLSPRTGLGLEAKKFGLGLGLGLGLDGNGLGLGLETLRPRPRVVRPRGLIYCNVLISCAVENICQFRIFSLISETATVKSVVMKTKDGNVVNSHIYCVGHQYVHLLLIHSGLGLGLGLDLVASASASYTSGLINIPGS